MITLGDTVIIVCDQIAASPYHINIYLFNDTVYISIFYGIKFIRFIIVWIKTQSGGILFCLYVSLITKKKFPRERPEYWSCI